MNKERFTEILKEYGCPEEQIEILWNTRPDDEIDEELLRYSIETLLHGKIKLVIVIE